MSRAESIGPEVKRANSFDLGIYCVDGGEWAGIESLNPAV